jgi:hypothetical protein
MNSLEKVAGRQSRLEAGAQALKEAALHILHQQTVGASVSGLAMLL